MTELGITKDGRISTIVNDTFDYERQTQVLIQVSAKDILQVYDEKIHVVFAQLVIDVIDVNDETPELRMVINLSLI